MSFESISATLLIYMDPNAVKTVEEGTNRLDIFNSTGF